MNEMARSKRIGILGAGIMGSTHAAAYKAFEGIEIAGIVGRSEATVQQVAGYFQIPYHTDPFKLINDPSVEAIDVCLPTIVHREYVIAALESGKHVFCETPVAFTLEDADAMLKAASKNGRILAVGLLLRFAAEYQYIHDQVASGSLGNPLAIQAYRMHSYLSPGDPANRPHYGDAISELMNFDFDFLNWLLGIPQEITATGVTAPGRDLIGSASAQLKYGRTKAIIEASAIMPTSLPYSIGLRVMCENGTLELATKFQGEVPESILTLSREPGETTVLNVPGHNPYEAELRYFVNCIDGQADPSLLSADRAKEALQVTLAAQESVRRNGERIGI